jgi:hypothetical protein
MLDEESISIWQSKKHKSGELLSIWDHETSKEIPCLVIKDCDKSINPFGRKSRIRKITIMSKYGIYEISKYEIYPPNEARPSIPF